MILHLGYKAFYGSSWKHKYHTHVLKSFLFFFLLPALKLEEAYMIAKGIALQL